MFLIAQIQNSGRLNRSIRQSLKVWFARLGKRVRLYETVRRERLALARLSDQELRDINIHRAEAEHESERSYFDMPENRK